MWMRIFKKWFNRFFLCSEMKLEFLFSTEIITIICTIFEHKEIADCFFVCSFCSKMRTNKRFSLRLPYCFSMCLDIDKKILPLCYKHVIAMGFSKIKEKYH